ncbi:hypothetical protein JNW89_20340 [Micromonospora sp. 4G55]|nr:hypothetical protein [Micromonospora sp. 4G55]
MPVLFSARTRQGLRFTCELDGGKRRITLPQEWTDRGPEASPSRLGVEGLAAARVVVDAVAARRTTRAEDPA